jgi:hypothetical protein
LSFSLSFVFICVVAMLVFAIAFVSSFPFHPAIIFSLSQVFTFASIFVSDQSSVFFFPYICLLLSIPLPLP